MVDNQGFLVQKQDTAAQPVVPPTAGGGGSPVLAVYPQASDSGTGGSASLPVYTVGGGFGNDVWSAAENSGAYPGTPAEKEQDDDNGFSETQVDKYSEVR